LPRIDFREYHCSVNRNSFGWSARRILVVEDDTAVRELLVRVLQDAGYLVAAARNASEALDLADLESSLDLLITDIVMRGMNGIELAQILVHHRPKLKVIITSSFRPERFGADNLEFATDFIQKPWTPREMVDCVATALARDA
jgi:DNA-binding NtrC family response regulator